MVLLFGRIHTCHLTRGLSYPQRLPIPPEPYFDRVAL
jgi:hypothetical protein